MCNPTSCFLQNYELTCNIYNTPHMISDMEFHNFSYFTVFKSLVSFCNSLVISIQGDQVNKYIFL